jgi:ubiquitin-activating enzyme E1 C
MAAPRSLEEATRPNLDRPLKDLIADGTHVTITDGSLPISMNAVIKLV